MYERNELCTANWVCNFRDMEKILLVGGRKNTPNFTLKTENSRELFLSEVSWRCGKKSSHLLPHFNEKYVECFGSFFNFSRKQVALQE